MIKGILMQHSAMPRWLVVKHQRKVAFLHDFMQSSLPLRFDLASMDVARSDTGTCQAA